MSDIRRRTINNKLCIIILVISIVISPVIYSAHWFLTALSVCFVLCVLYAKNIFGGGDVKLVIAFVPAVDNPYLLLLSIFLLGGCLAFFYLIYGLFTDMSKVRKKGLPFGVPICIASLALISSAF